jgi:hypothetical protein
MCLLHCAVKQPGLSSLFAGPLLRVMPGPVLVPCPCWAAALAVQRDVKPLLEFQEEGRTVSNVRYVAEYGTCKLGTWVL